MAANAELHRKLDKALDEGDMDTARGLVAENLRFHLAGDNPLAGDRHGRDEFFQMFQQADELAEGTLAIKHRETLDNDTHSVAISTVTATRDGETLAFDQADICRWENGKVVEEWVIPFDQRKTDAFWS